KAGRRRSSTFNTATGPSGAWVRSRYVSAARGRHAGGSARVVSSPKVLIEGASAYTAFAQCERFPEKADVFRSGASPSGSAEVDGRHGRLPGDGHGWRGLPPAGSEPPGWYPELAGRGLAPIPGG